MANPRAFSHKRNKNTKELGAFLTKGRLSSGISLKDAAKYINASIELLESYESGEISIPLNRVYALANCYNIPPAELLKKLHL